MKTFADYMKEKEIKRHMSPAAYNRDMRTFLRFMTDDEREVLKRHQPKVTFESTAAIDDCRSIKDHYGLSWNELRELIKRV